MCSSSYTLLLKSCFERKKYGETTPRFCALNITYTARGALSRAKHDYFGSFFLRDWHIRVSGGILYRYPLRKMAGVRCFSTVASDAEARLRRKRRSRAGAGRALPGIKGRAALCGKQPPAVERREPHRIKKKTRQVAATMKKVSGVI